MIRKKGNVYKIDTPNTSLVLSTERGVAEVLYYGKLLKAPFEPAAVTDDLSHCRKVFSETGKTDFREPQLRIELSDGSVATDFVLSRIKRGERPSMGDLPASYGEGETLRLEFFDEYARLRYYLAYTVYPDTDVICVTSEIVNCGKKSVRIQKAASLQLDLAGEGFTVVTYDGSWGAERQRHEHTLVAGVFVNESNAGSSSPFHNPFLMLKREGEVYATNLVYSGNHRETVETNSFLQTRLLTGISDVGFCWEVLPGESFVTPEAVMVYAPDEDGVACQMHAFVSEHVIRGKWKRKERPVLYNNWEGTTFAFTREKILSLADRAALMGAELFVLDDGWFGHRDDDHSSLGDWFDYEAKTGGIASLADAIRAKGLKFGIWVEPEMISEDSELFAKHPEFAMKPLRKAGTKMRNQLLLNLADKQVQNYVVRAVSHVIQETKAAYVKWDYNRFFTDPYGKGIASGEYCHRYMLGLYSVLSRLVEKFPSVLFESCASGGGRYDPGMLCFMPQTWASDNTDARERYRIQQGTLQAYPKSTMGAHVSASPNQQSGFLSTLETRFNVASAGVLGYELDLAELTDEELSLIQRQIEFYQANRELLQFGTYYRLDERSGLGGFITVSPDRTKAIAVITANERVTGRGGYAYTLKGLDPSVTYSVTTREQQGYEGTESFLASGETLMNAPLYRPDIMGDRENRFNSIFSRMLVLKKVSMR
ncbi:MAG: alpha-galactosidase [Christensenellaceae bacterium]